jgi:hypothetical protein
MGDVFLAAGAHLPLVGRLAECEGLRHTIKVGGLEVRPKDGQQCLELFRLACGLASVHHRSTTTRPVTRISDIDYRN